MAKATSYLKLFLAITCLIVINSCNKDADVKLTFQGRIVDGQTMQPVPNYGLSLDFNRPSTSGMGFNFGSQDDIANGSTNKYGDFSIKVRKTYAIDNTDTYEIVSSGSNEYFGIGKIINAKEAESTKINFIDSLVVYRKMIVNVFVRHLGPSNADDNILINYNGIELSSSDLFYGSDSLKQNSHELVPNSPTVISWQGIKNNIRYGPITDTVVFTKEKNTYFISY